MSFCDVMGELINWLYLALHITENTKKKERRNETKVIYLKMLLVDHATEAFQFWNVRCSIILLKKCFWYVSMQKPVYSNSLLKKHNSLFQKHNGMKLKHCHASAVWLFCLQIARYDQLILSNVEMLEGILWAGYLHNMCIWTQGEFIRKTLGQKISLLTWSFFRKHPQ